MLQQIEKRLDLKALKEEIRKLGVNFLTTGTIGVFVNHIVGNHVSVMFWTFFWISLMGILCLSLGIMRKK